MQADTASSDVGGCVVFDDCCAPFSQETRLQPTTAMWLALQGMGVVHHDIAVDREYTMMWLNTGSV